MKSEILVTENLTKIFPGVIAVDKVNFNLLKGEIHGLVGENGAGKSTLMKMLDGSYSPDGGKIVLGGLEVKFNSPENAARMGIGMVYQELMLLPYQSIAENICISKLVVNKVKIVNWKDINQTAFNKLKELGFKYDVRIKVKDVSVANQQIIAIARALISNCKVLILDEPTSALPAKDVSILFQTMNRLKEHGVAMIFISHRLEEVLKISDRVTVLRDGRKIGTFGVKELSEDKIAELIVGRKVKDKYPKISTTAADTILRVKKMNIGDKVKNASFEVKKGQILGVVGAMGAGKTEIAKSLFGAYLGKVQGNIYLQNKKVLISSPSDAIRIGISLVTEDRREEGLIINQGIRFNTSLSIMGNISKFGFINLQEDIEIANKSVKKLNIKCTSIEQKAEFLSGGNQQKVVLGKWMATTKLKIIILDEPTRGIDIGAKVEIYKIINQLVKNGIGILFFSSEVPEVCGIADKILVLYRGTIIHEQMRSKKGFNEQLIQKLVLSGLGGNNS